MTAGIQHTSPSCHKCWAWVPARAQHSCDIMPDVGPHRQQWHRFPTLPVSVRTPGTTSKSLLTSLNMGSSGRCFRANSRCSTGDTIQAVAWACPELRCGKTALGGEAAGSEQQCSRMNRGSMQQTSGAVASSSA